MALTFLIEIGCLIAGVQSTLRYSWGARATGYRTRPTDTPANASYHPRLSGCTFRYDVSGDALRLGSGQIVLDNTDGTLDALLDYVYDSQTAKLLVVDENAAYTAAKELARWTVEQASDGDRTVTLVTRSPVYNLDKALQTVRYGGTGGVDGGTELTNKPKPFAAGVVRNARPVLVDPTKLIYQLSSHHGFAYTIDASLGAVTDEGIAATPGADYASVAQMLSTAPAGADDYRVCNAAASGATYDYGVYVRFQSQPVGEVGFTGTFFPNSSTTASTLLATLLAVASLGSTLYSSDLTAVAAAFPQQIMLFFGSDGVPATFLDALRPILDGMRGWVAPYHGVPTQSPASGYTPPWAVRWLDTPASAVSNPYKNDLIDLAHVITPYLTIDGSRIMAPLVRRAEYEFGWPEFRVTLLYERFSFTQTQGLAAGTLAYPRARFALEYLSTSDDDTSVLTSFPTAADRTVTTAWSDAGSPVAAEATRQLGVFSEHHPAFEVSARVDLYHGALTIPGDPMDIVNYPRHGCDVSRTFMILGMELDYLAFDESANTIGFTGTLWG